MVPKKKEESKPAASTTNASTSSTPGFNGPKPTESTLEYAHRIITEKKLAEDVEKARTTTTTYPLTRVASFDPEVIAKVVGARQSLPIAPTQSAVQAWENPNDPDFKKFHPNAPASFYGRQLGHGGVPEKVTEDPEVTKKLYQDAAKNWSDAVKAAVEAAAG